LILFISDVKGEPWGKGDDEAATRFRDAWTLLLGDIPERLLMEAAADFLKLPGKKWPQPGDLRDHAKKFMPVVEAPDRHGHEIVYDYSTLPLRVREQESTRRLERQGCSPSYIEFHLRDRALTRDALAKVEAMDEATLRRLGLDDWSIRTARRIMGGQEQQP
jgi:hypothetical protein